MVDWQVTATSIYCDSVGDEVTIIVHKDWSAKCTGHSKYSEAGKQVSSRKKKSRQMGRDLKCEGLNCQQITRYKEKLSAEEAKKGKG
ncbi:MAG: hypothetical protein V1767_00205 [Chloroflexota bacterium]